MTETARLFTAFELMGALRFVIPERIVRELKQANIPHLDVEDRENLHITFNFLGDVPVEKIDDVLGHIEDSAANFRDGCNGIAVKHGGIGAFPDVLLDPRVLFLAVKDRSGDGQPSICDLQADLAARLAKTVPSQGVEQYEYTPHITLGRFKPKMASLYERRRALEVATTALKHRDFDHQGYINYSIRRISLLRSIRHPEGDIEYRRVGGSNIAPTRGIPIAVRRDARRFA